MVGTGVMSGWRFRWPGVVVTAAALAVVAVCITAGNWQTRRAEYKEVLAAQLDSRAAAPPERMDRTPVVAEDWAFRRVRLRGEFVPDKGLLLDNRVLRGRVGYEVLAPLRIEGSDLHVLVNRGWIAAPPTRAELPAVSTPPGVQEIEGVAVLPPARVFELGDGAPAGAVWQHFLMERYQKWSGLALQPVIVQQTSAAPDGLAREWSRPDTGVQKHRGYAMQWYLFAVLVIVLYVSLNLRRRPRNA
jgi:surfeit locus 1 family protein